MLYSLHVQQNSVPLDARPIIESMLQKHHAQYPPGLRRFALTLDFYSPRAYEYVRKVLNNSLPNRRTIQKWYETVDCQAGFSKEALHIVSLKAEESKAQNKKVVVSLMMDEMSVRKYIDWDGHKMVGYTDFGADMQEESSTEEASEVLVFMVNCVNGAWKIPVEYFFIS